MSIHIIIDGYNLIRQSDTLTILDAQDLQLGREALIDMLAAYKRVKSHRITVVFDGSNAPSFSQKSDRSKGITIKFSSTRESADTVIKRMSAMEKEKALIVSSDQDIINFAEAQGSATISSPAFDDKLGSVAYMHTREDDTDDEGG